MVFWQRLLRNLGLWPHRGQKRLSFHADETLIDTLQLLAERERRTKEAVATDLLGQAILKRQASDTHLHHWETLSAREQQVAALICLNYTNAQIANLLGLSPETIKTHVRNVLIKFKLRRKAELRRALEDWDFNSWVDPPSG
ncbi:MAG: DNA-binding response regulator [Chloroflexi bacterium]|nr:MAG: DNA-binding response regulator [Chloroflexota bacterium]